RGRRDGLLHPEGHRVRRSSHPHRPRDSRGQHPGILRPHGRRRRPFRPEGVLAMRMEVHLQQRMEQRMHLSQQMLQNLELLQLPIMELRDLIQQELEENPALEEKQDVEEPETPAAETVPEETLEETVKREMLETVEDQWSDSERRTRRSDS